MGTERVAKSRERSESSIHYKSNGGPKTERLPEFNHSRFDHDRDSLSPSEKKFSEKRKRHLDGIVYARKVTPRDAERFYDRNLIMVMRKEELIRKQRKEKRLAEKKELTFKPDLGKSQRAVPRRGDGASTTMTRERTNKSLVPSHSTKAGKGRLNETRYSQMIDKAEVERRTRELESQAITNYIDRMKRGQEER